MPSRVLIVDVDHDFTDSLAVSSVSAGWEPVVHHTFADARRELARQCPAALVANIRLGAFNGIQLAYLARQCSPRAALILYSVTDDHVLIREARAAGAFYEPMSFVPHSLTGYLSAALPVGDRRNSVNGDRRRAFRGGRRSTDIPSLRGAAHSG
jgi:DNA-binding response OmpR family regulator